jgi:hypothetical protein
MQEQLPRHEGHEENKISYLCSHVLHRESSASCGYRMQRVLHGVPKWRVTAALKVGWMRYAYPPYNNYL